MNYGKTESKLFDLGGEQLVDVVFRSRVKLDGRSIGDLLPILIELLLCDLRWAAFRSWELAIVRFV